MGDLTDEVKGLSLVESEDLFFVNCAFIIGGMLGLNRQDVTSAFHREAGASSR